MATWRVECCDCLDFLRTLPAGSVDAVVTDPPYNAVNRPIGKMRSCRSMDKGSADSASVDIEALAEQFVRVCRGSFYVWCSTEQAGEWRRAFQTRRLTTRQCAWIRTNPSPLNCEKFWLSGMELCIFARKPNAVFHRFFEVPVWHGSAERVDGFPCPKPVWLIKELVDASTDFGATVLDPFAGSGTTGVACIQTGRNFVGCEIDAGYAEIARRRCREAEESVALFAGVQV